MLSKNQIKLIQSLHQKKYRDLHGLFLVEGKKMVHELIANFPERVQLLVTDEEHIQTIALPKTIDSYSCDTQTFRKMSNNVSPQGILAVVKHVENEYQKEDFMLALDEIQDPGNLGTILRTADWFGIRQVVCSKTCADKYNPKVIQASMGSIFRTRISYQSLPNFIAEAGLPVYGAFLEGENVYQTKLKRKGILLMGNEGKGISSELIPLIQHRISIPRFGEAESLNVSTATAVLLSEFLRNS